MASGEPRCIRAEHQSFRPNQTYLGIKPIEAIDPTKILKLFGGRGAYRRFILESLGGGHKEEYYDVDDQRFLGPEGFGDKIQEHLGKEQKTTSKKSIGPVVVELSKKLGIRLIFLIISLISSSVFAAKFFEKIPVYGVIKPAAITTLLAVNHGMVSKVPLLVGDSAKFGQVVLTVVEKETTRNYRTTLQGKVAKIHVTQGAVTTPGMPLITGRPGTSSRR